MSLLPHIARQWWWLALMVAAVWLAGQASHSVPSEVITQPTHTVEVDVGQKLAPPDQTPEAYQDSETIQAIRHAKPGPIFRLMVKILVSLALVAVIVHIIRLVMKFHRRRLHRTVVEADLPDDDALAFETLEEIRTHLDNLLQELRIRGDTNDAIIACWRHLEHVAADNDIPRMSHQTAGDFAAELLHRTTIAHEDLTILTQLYQEAQFSTHNSDDTTRIKAVAALEHAVESLGAHP